jgi:hypothetical protein
MAFGFSGRVTKLAQDSILSLEYDLIWSDLNKKIVLEDFMRDCSIEEFSKWQAGSRIANIVEDANYDVVSFYLKNGPAFISMRDWDKWQFGEPYSISIRVPKSEVKSKSVEIYFESFREILEDKKIPGLRASLLNDSSHCLKFFDYAKGVFLIPIWTVKHGDQKLNYLMDDDMGLTLPHGRRRSAESITSWTFATEYAFSKENFKRMLELRKEGFISKIYVFVDK